MLGPSSRSTDWPDPTVYRQYPVNPVALLPGFRVKILNFRFSGVVVVVRDGLGWDGTRENVGSKLKLPSSGL